MHTSAKVPLPRLRIPPRIILRRGIVLFMIAGLGYWLAAVVFGPNVHTVIPNKVYRCAQPSGPTLTSIIQARQIRTVVNLRGFSPSFDWYQQESSATAAAGIHQVDITLSASRLPPPQELHRLLEVLDRAEYPVLIHCKQGADRTGLVSAFVVLLLTDGSLNTARRELWPTRGHVALGRVYAMDEFLDRYESWLKEQRVSHTQANFRHWVMNEYQPGVAASSLTWASPPPLKHQVGQPLALKVEAVNRSKDVWQFTPGRTAGIHLRYSLWKEGAATPLFMGEAGLFRRVVPPNERITFDLGFPKVSEPGQYLIRAEMVDYRGAGVEVRSSAFVQFGDEPLFHGFTVVPGSN